MFWCAFIALFYFIASIVIATIANQAGIYGGAAVNDSLKEDYKEKKMMNVFFFLQFFGFAAFITYVADGIFQFRTYRSRSYDSSREQQYAPNPNEQRQQPTY